MIAVLMNSLAGGGAERVGLTLLKELTSKGYPTLLICIDREQSYEVPEGVEIIYLSKYEKVYNPIFKALWIFIGAYKLSALIKDRQITVVQSHITRSNFINVGAKFFGAKHYAQIVTHLPIHFKPKGILPALKKSYYTWFHRRANEAVSISKVMEKGLEDAMQLKASGVNHRIIYNPHDIKRIRGLTQKEVTNFQFSPDKKYIISAGRLVKHKRVDDLVKAMATLRKEHQDVELLILGSGAEMDHLKELIASLNLGNSTHLLGHISNPFPFIAQSTLFILASEREGLPNIIIESLACETPVISSDCISGPREILSPSTDFKFQLKDEVEFAEYGILYPVGNIQLLAQTIAKILNDQELQQKYTQKSLERALSFQKSIIADQYLEHIHDIVN